MVVSPKSKAWRDIGVSAYLIARLVSIVSRARGIASAWQTGVQEGRRGSNSSGGLILRKLSFDERKIVVLRSDASDKTVKQNESHDHFWLADHS